MSRRIVKSCALLVGALAIACTGPALAADDWQAGAGPEWQKAMAAAKQEGKVVLAGPAPISKSLSTGFEADTGIPVEYVTGSINDMATRFEREAKAGNMTVDVIIGGGVEMFTMYLPGYLEPIKPKLMLPGVTRPENWIGGKIKWFDNQESYMPLVSNWVHGWPVLNSEKLDVAQIHTWQDLLKPEYKGKIASYDPRLGGPGQSAAAYLVHQFGLGYVKQLFIGQEVTYTRDSRQVVEWAARGTYPIALGAIQFEVERFRKGGVKTLTVPTLPDGPGTLTGGFGIVKLPKGAPHPSAATVFVNWIMSKPGHIAYASAMLETSTRVDAQIPEVPDYVNPKPGAKYLDQYTEDWYKNERPKLGTALVEALGGR